MRRIIVDIVGLSFWRWQKPVLGIAFAGLAYCYGEHGRAPRWQLWMLWRHFRFGNWGFYETAVSFQLRCFRGLQTALAMAYTVTSLRELHHRLRQVSCTLKSPTLRQLLAGQI